MCLTLWQDTGKIQGRVLDEMLKTLIKKRLLKQYWVFPLLGRDGIPYHSVCI